MLNPVSWLRESDGGAFTSRSRPIQASLVILGIACIGTVAFEVAKVIIADFLGLF